MATKKNKKDTDVTSEAEVSQPKAEGATKEKSKAELEAEKQEKAAKKIEVTLYPNLQVKVVPIQNIASFAEVRVVANAAASECNDKNVANAAAMLILNTFARTQAKARDAEREKKIHVPGEK